MVKKVLFRLLTGLFVYGSLTACNSEAVNRDQMVPLQKAAVKTGLNLGDLNLALHQDRDNATLFAKRGRLYLERREIKKALADLNRAVNLDPNNGEFHFQKAIILRAAGEVAKAREAAGQAEQLGYKDKDVLILQAELLVRLRDYQKALEKSNLALAQNPENQFALFYRGMARAALRDTASAIINFRRAIQNDSTFLEPVIQLAAIYNALFDFEQAQYYVNKGQRLNPNHALLWYQQGLRYQGMRRPDSAYYSLNKAVNLSPQLYQAHYQLGKLYFGQRAYPEAVSHLEKVKAVTDSLPDLTLMLAEGYEKTHRYPLAVQAYKQLVLANPANAKAQWGLKRSSWALYKLRRDSLRQNGLETNPLLYNLKKSFN